MYTIDLEAEMMSSCFAALFETILHLSGWPSIVTGEIINYFTSSIAALVLESS